MKIHIIDEPHREPTAEESRARLEYHYAAKRERARRGNLGSQAGQELAGLSFAMALLLSGLFILAAGGLILFGLSFIIK